MPHLKSEEQMPAIIAFIRKGWKIEAIKEFRCYYGVGLKEAKDAVESIAAALGIGLGTVGFTPKVEAPKKYIVLDRSSEFGDFDLTRCMVGKLEAEQLASNLVTNSQKVIIATIVSESETVTSRVMKDAA